MGDGWVGVVAGFAPGCPAIRQAVIPLNVYTDCLIGETNCAPFLTFLRTPANTEGKYFASALRRAPLQWSEGGAIRERALANMFPATGSQLLLPN